MAEWALTTAPVKHPSLRAQIVHRADSEYPFLHDTMIVSLGGRLLMAWYNCTEDEIAGRTVIRGRWSSDGGQSWSAPEIICEDPQNTLHMVPVTFTEHAGQIWAYVTQMTAHDRPVGYICVQYENGAWKIRERRVEPVLFNTLPQLTDGHWIVGGRRAAESGELPQIPMVALAVPSDPAAWEFVDLPGPWLDGEYTLEYPETAVLADGPHVEAITRSDSGPAQLFSSADNGHTWSTGTDCALPIGHAKICCGCLPDGRQYVIYNELTPSHDRSRLVLALRKGRGAPFDAAYLLADGADGTLDAGPYWHYPCACVAGGYLYISCTSSASGIMRHAALFTLPLSSLMPDDQVVQSAAAPGCLKQ